MSRKGLLLSLVFLLVVPLAWTSGTVHAQCAGTTHVVRTGETLSAISRTYNITMDSIAAVNGITNYNLVYIGQSLCNFSKIWRFQFFDRWFTV